MVTINSKEINDKIASLPSREDLSKEQQRQEDIAAINDYAIRNPNKVFNDDFKEQRKHLTEETWKAIIQANPDMQDSASPKWRHIPNADIVNKYQGQAFSGEVRKAINEDGVKVAGLAAAVPGAIIGADLLASAAPTAINFLTKAGEKAYPFTQKWIEPVFNKMNPFSKEFAQMGLLGKSAVGALESLGAHHAINTTADFIKDPKVYKIPDVVMADMIGLPYGLAAGQRLYGAYNKATAPFRMARLMNQNVKNTNLGTTVFDDAVLQGKVGWGPKQNVVFKHGSENPDLQTFIPYETWDVKHRGASPYKYFATEHGSPHNMMDDRPFQYVGQFDLEKPIVQIGEFNVNGAKNTTRNQLVQEARNRGADSYYMKGIYDNKADDQNVIIKFIYNEGETPYMGLTSKSSTLTEAERLGIPKGDRNNNKRYGNIKFIRNIGLHNQPNYMPYISDGKIKLSPDENLLVNLTTDLPFRTHQKYAYRPGGEIMIIDPKAFRGQTFLSLDPSDSMVLNKDLVVDPKHVQIITGNKDIAKTLSQSGITTHTSPKLQIEYKKAMQANPQTQIGKIRLDKKKFGDTPNEYTKAVDDFITKYIGRPDLGDYQKLQQTTNINPHVTEFNDQINQLQQLLKLNTTKLKEASDLEDINLFTFPDKTSFTYYDVAAPSTLNKTIGTPYKNVFYNPFSSIEDDLMHSLGIGQHPKYSDEFQNILKQYILKNNIKPLKKQGGTINYLNLFK